mmetsp:Transcript_22152/g.57799  ORF Transcript_22152/g.57799 Transcript_22152/m.57799 type:complete len:222 (+) Transcript_22152:278-943(+)
MARSRCSAACLRDSAKSSSYSLARSMASAFFSSSVFSSTTSSLGFWASSKAAMSPWMSLPSSARRLKPCSLNDLKYKADISPPLDTTKRFFVAGSSTKASATTRHASSLEMAEAKSWLSRSTARGPPSGRSSAKAATSNDTTLQSISSPSTTFNWSSGTGPVAATTTRSTVLALMAAWRVAPTSVGATSKASQAWTSAFSRDVATSPELSSPKRNTPSKPE